MGSITGLGIEMASDCRQRRVLAAELGSRSYEALVFVGFDLT